VDLKEMNACELDSSGSENGSVAVMNRQIQ